MTVPIPKPTPYDLPVMKLTTGKSVALKDGKIEQYRALFVYWFVSDRRITARHDERMWWMTKDLLTTGVLSRWAYIAYFTVCRPGEEKEAFELLERFIAASVPEFQLVHSPGASSAPAEARSQM
jgi:hypothetical protein